MSLHGLQEGFNSISSFAWNPAHWNVLYQTTVYHQELIKGACD